MAHLGQHVFYFPDYGSAYPVPMVAQITGIQGGVLIAIEVKGQTQESGGFSLYGENCPQQAATSLEAVGSSNTTGRWATKEQVEGWGLMPSVSEVQP